MVNFRRVVTVLAVLTLFTGLAFAQQETCSAQGTASNPLRAEGYTEESGDIVITCNLGTALGVGTNIPLVNITVFYNTTVTSRLLGSALPSGQTPSEALLLIDDPNTHIGATPDTTTPITYGSTLPLIPCLTPATGCAQVVGPVATGGYATAVNPGTTTPAPNVYQGVTSGNSVTFYGVPALPPSTVGSRIYRITNVRVNATTGGTAQGTVPVQGFITVSGAASLPISNSQPIVGYIQTSLTAKVKDAGNFNQCVSQGLDGNGKPVPTNPSGTLVFQELFGSAFKTRVDAKNNPAPGAGQLAVSVPPQDVPGIPVNSESNFVYADAYGHGGNTVGLADFGTRLKATFNNVPSGVHIFVTTANTGANASAQAIPGGSGGNATVVDYVGLAQMINGETTTDGTGTIPAVSTDVTGTAYSEVTIVAGTGTAVWEVINTNPNTSESFSFGVAVSYAAATATNTPLPGTATVTLSYAPTATSGAASGSLPIPRFSIGNFSGNSFTINVCRTILLYPYVTNQQGFDTGLTVANTSTDPFGTGAQQGACQLNYYGGLTATPLVPPAPTSTGVVASGTVWASTLNTIAPTFQGYVFAICNFQFAHGFAFISDLGARNLAMGYLALIIPDMGSGARTATPFGTGAATGEQDAH